LTVAIAIVDPLSSLPVSGRSPESYIGPALRKSDFGRLKSPEGL
jgi:hypothetical protein